MYQQLFTRLALSGSGASEVSVPVSMQGANAAQVDYVVMSIAGTSTPTISLQLQESNDLENWTNKGSAVTPVTATGYALAAAVTGISAAFIRLRVSITAGTSPVFVVAASLNTSKL